jgi:PIN domain nuclease of toxin-antitoxin system
MLNLDTHILLFALAGELKPKEQRLLAAHPWSISAIVLWEISKLAQLGRIAIGLDDPELNAALRSVHVWPLTLEICRTLGALDFKSDPADEIIAATSIVHGVPLVTRDHKLLKSRAVPKAR